MINQFNFCPECGSKKIITHEGRKWTCPECGFDLYNNVAAAVGVVIYDKDFNILLEVRAKEPRKGFLALPGGFVDADESGELAVIRECQEELGIKLSGAEFLCSYPNTYEYKKIVYKTCDIFFTAKLSENETVDDVIRKTSLQKSEVVNLVTASVKTKEDIEKLPLAFDSARKTLIKWLEKR